jgi:hypothetical protein
VLAVTAIEYLELGVEQYLRELPDAEFEALLKAVRPPKAAGYPAPKNRTPLQSIERGNQ